MPVVDIGRTWTEAPGGCDAEQFLAHLRAGRAEARGDQGCAAKWAHAAMALAIRALGRGERRRAAGPGAVLRDRRADRARGRHAQRTRSAAASGRRTRAGCCAPGSTRSGSAVTDAELLEWLQVGRLLARRPPAAGASPARAQLHAAVARALVCARGGRRARAAARWRRADALFDACLAGVPYAPGDRVPRAREEQAAGREGEPVRVALVADGVGGMHGVTHTLEEIRERGVPGFEVEVIGTDMNVDRRLPAVAEVEIPFYAGLEVGVPSLPAVVEALADGRYGLVHSARPGRPGSPPRSPLTSSSCRSPAPTTRSSPPTRACVRRPGARARRRGGPGRLLRRVRRGAVAVRGLGRPAGRARRRRRPDRPLGPRRRRRPVPPAASRPGRFGEAIHVLYAGRQTAEKGVDLLAESFLPRATATGGCTCCSRAAGPRRTGCARASAQRRRSSAGSTATTSRSRTRARTCCCSAQQTDTFGNVVLEAQASGLPVVAVAAGGPAELIESGRSGLLCPPDPAVIGAAVARLASARPRASSSHAAAWPRCATALGKRRSRGSRTAGGGRWPRARAKRCDGPRDAAQAFPTGKP